MNSTRYHHSQRGVALPLALFTLVIAAVMITAVFYVGRLEQRMGNNSIAATQAFEAAETGITSVMNNWSPQTYNTLANGGTVVLPSVSVGHSAVYNASVRRLNTYLFLIQAEGRYLVAGSAVTRRQLARVARLDAPLILPPAAVVNRTGLTVSGTATVDGQDRIPSGWPSCTSGSSAPAIIDSAGIVATNPSCAGQSCLSGSVPVQADNSISSPTFSQLGSMTYNDLVLSADKSVSGSYSSLGPSYTAGPTCNQADDNNWGSPEDQSDPCAAYFPVIYAPGDLDLAGGTGQGLLLVDGDLSFSGNARFYGAIIVNGRVTLSGGEIHGTIFIRNQNGTGSTIDGTHLEFSRCAIQKASASAALAKPMSERSWIQLY